MSLVVDVDKMIEECMTAQKAKPIKKLIKFKDAITQECNISEFPKFGLFIDEPFFPHMLKQYCKDNKTDP